MNKIKLMVVVALILFLVGAIQVSAYNPNGLVVSQLDAFESSVIVGVDNNRDVDARHIRVTAVIPELGIRYRSGPFTLDSGKETINRLLLEAPEEISGEYVVRVVVNDGETRRIKHRFITFP
ncbi:MAG: hypothetical protein GY861_08950 [bacterium]|nr:hypothetical protein [bacterium]